MKRQMMAISCLTGFEQVNVIVVLKALEKSKSKCEYIFVYNKRVKDNISKPCLSVTHHTTHAIFS